MWTKAMVPFCRLGRRYEIVGVVAPVKMIIGERTLSFLCESRSFRGSILLIQTNRTLTPYSS